MSGAFIRQYTPVREAGVDRIAAAYRSSVLDALVDEWFHAETKLDVVTIAIP